MVIVGAGVVGNAIARELSRFRLRIVLLEAGTDVGAGTSKANTGLLHTGFDAKPGTIESRLVRRGHELLLKHAPVVGIPVEPVGALLVAWDREQLESFPGIVARSHANGYTGIRQLTVEELRRREPSLGPGAVGALEVPDEAIICPFTTTLAFATEAVAAGCELHRSTPVIGVERLGDQGFRVLTPGGPFTTKIVVNAAGLFSDEIDRMLGYDGFTITPRRGELLVFDKLARPLLQHVILAVPTVTTKGVLVAPTVYGNVLVGPTAVDIQRKDDRSSTSEGLAYLRAEAARILPSLLHHDVTAVYVGLRAATEHTDYQLSVHASEGYTCVGGIRSTGMSASMAIAEYVRDELAAAGLALEPKDHIPQVQMPNIGEAFVRPYMEPDRIARNAAYGRVVCFCERVTEGEIRDALRSRVPPTDLDGLRRRTRVLMGRCQGFFCGARVQSLLAGPLDEPSGTSR